ncbi:NADH-quinone oxidoreductase subunit NuoG [Methylobacterium haplocladii]|uniref:NADH-quinone oxidoreductase n=1 Tax=Methylobacterium haplocladii TaxID=1176176 RepID=A0A512ISX7_9HYPH|nr:NADH-quinone oxidoreductase subunit NuoG [Methylobacterium haplocladii]GEP00810.1 NADH-quinone oxidoreductase [Methylobacterium haplocladii]GJD86471.1 NADH-quinone oxidoreductase chain 3 [Methylobacterium haplocladii]GLS59296.1 NADH-quinone oxidoreductase [Methylobacterium haplocladii]
MTKLLVDGIEVDVPADYTLLQACEIAGAEIPRFCFHERLSIAGNCRMCLVELKGAPKPVASCAYAVKDCRPGPNGEPPEVLTRSGTTKKAREGVMEFLLINHPLDCPICDQGGHCDLQDQAMAYGVDSTRYQENKRAVEEKYIGPLVRTAMNRCIHCTRCVRFLAEVAGVPDLGAIGRGEDMEITSYLENAMGSELQGNVADLCPVGALVPKPQSYDFRPWELSKTDSIDVMDAVGSAIRVDARGREVMQIGPRVNEDINEEWISDKTRQVVDGLRMQRLDRPFLRENGRLRPASWGEAFSAIAAKVKGADPKRIGALVGDLAGVEEIFALKQLMSSVGTANIDARQAGEKIDPVWGRAAYTLSATIPGIEQADAILLIGTNPRLEASLLNVRIRKRWRMAPLAVGVIGEDADLTYPHVYLGAGTDTLSELAAGKHSFSEVLSKAERPLVIVGSAALSRADGAAVLSAAASLAKGIGAVTTDWNGFAVLHTAAARVGALDLGFVPGEGGLDVAGMIAPGALDVIFNLGADEVEIAAGAFVVYQGTHGDRGAMRADVILPGAAYTEKSATFVNTEGRVQMTNRAGFPPGDAREDWAILRALSDVLGHRLPYDSLGALRRALYAAHPHLAGIDAVKPSDLAASLETLAGLGGSLGREAFGPAVADFYMTNPIARASRVMAECSSVAHGRVLQAAE